jgi:imidazolonepropionase-like amidohydrolase
VYKANKFEECLLDKERTKIEFSNFTFQQMNTMFKYFILGLIAFPLFATAQVNHPTNGVKPTPSPCIAIKNVRILVSPTKTIENGTILFRDNEIVEVGKIVVIPKGTVEIDGQGKTIVPSFIELNSNVGLPEVRGKEFSFRPQLETSKLGAYYWNEAIHPESMASTNYNIDSRANTTMHKMGFGFAVSHFQDGIARGSGTLISLGNEEIHKNMLYPQVASFFSFDAGVSRQTYPSSQMGSIALLRQSLYDYKWYENNSTAPYDLSLEAYKLGLKLPLFFQTEDKWEILRANRIAEEFKLDMIYFGSGNEYVAVDDLKNIKAKLVLPINFPAAYDVTDPYISRQIPLSTLKHWEMAPYNPKIMADAGLQFALSSYGLTSPEEFWGNLQKLIEAGLSASDALAALTTIPAEMLKMESLLGTLDKGKRSCFTIYDGNPFEEKCEIVEVWINGKQHVYKTTPTVDIRGNYNLIVDGKSFPIQIEGTQEKPTGKIQYPNPDPLVKDSIKIKPFIEVTGNDVVLQFAINNEEWKGSVNLKGKYTEKIGVFEGSGQIPNGAWVKWSAVRNEKFKDQSEVKKFKIRQDTVRWDYTPYMAFARADSTKKETLLIKNVTLWTNESQGIIQKGNIVITNGKITAIGENVTAVGAREIDGTGKHLTPGIIDEHSHIAISKGVNESGQAVTAEVSIADVVDPDDINIYRQLSGGVTAAQLLHGSANPIGGQSALIKLKWGYNPLEMLIKDAPKFIKCALGENVKQANWGDFNTVRFPQTRMGVEQVFYDAFLRARAYEKEKAKGDYRVDLELEALLEILNSKRFITCHSYVQSEINMLMHVADSMGFKINTFTHILEGYKLADKMAAHGAGGSTFADWWAYKYEVKDAIPYNSVLMQEQGVVVAVNSDDAEMGRRLNQEAAKAVKYGGMSQEDALKLVTLNPAKLLHLDDRMGSLKVGKDADVVLWSDNPLSAQAKAEITIVDGEILYDRSKDLELLTRDAAEKARILSAMLQANEKGEAKVPFFKKKMKLFHCDTVGEEGSSESNHH